MHVFRIERPLRPVPDWLDKRAEGGLTRHDSDFDRIAVRRYSRGFKINKKEGRSTLLLLFEAAIFSGYTDCLCVCAAIARTSRSSC